MKIGQTVYVNYKGCEWHATVTGREFPYYIVELSNGLELSFYEDELKEV